VDRRGDSAGRRRRRVLTARREPREPAQKPSLLCYPRPVARGGALLEGTSPLELHARGVITPLAPVEVDESAARRSLRDQIARLESELANLFCSTYPRQGFDWAVRSSGGPRILSLAELERVRDQLLMRLDENRRLLSEQTQVEQDNRCLIEEMMLDPARYKWQRVGNCDIGEPGCKHWHVTPRWGVLGMLMNWWRVKISSGCPLAGGRSRTLRPRSHS